MGCVILLNTASSAFLANIVQSWHDESVSNNKLSNLTTGELGCHGFLFYSWWQGGTVGHPLSCCFCSIACLKLSTTIRHLHLHGFPSRSRLFFYSNKERGRRETCFLRIKMHPISTFWQKQMTETNVIECRSIRRSLSPSLCSVP